MNIQQEALGKERWDLRIGIHSGPVIAGTSGNAFDIWGDSVNIAARMESSGEPGKIHISEKTADFLDGTGCDLQGKSDFEKQRGVEHVFS